jgi:hypothetical protein
MIWPINEARPGGKTDSCKPEDSLVREHKLPDVEIWSPASRQCPTLNLLLPFHTAF